MAAKRELTMGQIGELLCLAHDGCSVRDMAGRSGVTRSTIQDNLKRARDADLTWPLPDDLTNDFLEQSLFARTGTRAGFRRRREPDWGLLAREMKRPGVNLSVFWEEDRQVHPEGYGYARFASFSGTSSSAFQRSCVRIMSPATKVSSTMAARMRRLGVSRKELFETIERPALRPLPAEA